MDISELTVGDRISIFSTAQATVVGIHLPSNTVSLIYHWTTGDSPPMDCHSDNINHIIQKSEKVLQISNPDLQEDYDFCPSCKTKGRWVALAMSCPNCFKIW